MQAKKKLSQVLLLYQTSFKNGRSVAYKKQALKHHPDRNRDNVKAATEKFKQVISM